MIQTLKNGDGYIYAYIEYEIVDKNGQFKDGGEYCYVQDYWKHPKLRRGTFRDPVLKKLISKMHNDPFMRNVIGIYWKNLRRDERQTVAFSRSRLAKLGE